VTNVEALRVDIWFVDVDLDQVNPGGVRHRQQLANDGRADPAPAELGYDIARTLRSAVNAGSPTR